MVLRRALVFRHLLFLEPVGMLRVLPVALLTEAEVGTSETVKPVGATIDGLVALIAYVP